MNTASTSTLTFTDNGTSTYLTTLTDNLAIGTSTAYSKLTVWGDSTGTGAEIFNITDNASTTLLTVLDNGNVGIASTSPWGLLSVNPNGISGPSFVIGSSTATDFYRYKCQGM